MHHCAVLVRLMISWHTMPVTYQIDMRSTLFHTSSLVLSFNPSSIFNTKCHTYPGDNAYPDEDFLLTPSPAGSTEPTHDVYNCYLSQLRITIERSFGILNTVCAILQKPLKFNVPKSVKVRVSADVCSIEWFMSKLSSPHVVRWCKRACDCIIGESIGAARK